MLLTRPVAGLQRNALHLEALANFGEITKALRRLAECLVPDKKKTGRARQSIHVCLLFNRAELQLPTKVEKKSAFA